MRFEPWDLAPDTIGRRLRDLQFTFGKWDLYVEGRGTVAPGALVLTKQEHEFVVDASERLYQVSRQAQEKWPEQADSAQELGVDPWVAARARDEVPSGFLTRIDFFLTSQGWRISEFNDDCPGGYNEAIGLPALFGEALPHGVPGDLPDALPAWVGRSGSSVGIVYATGYSEDLQVVALLAHLCRGQGLTVVLGSPEQFMMEGGRATLAGQPIDVILRFYPTQWMPLLRARKAWEEAAGRIPVLSPLRTAFTQSKASFGRLQPGALGNLAPLIPHSQNLDAELAQQLSADKESWVVKPCSGRMGSGVCVGAAVSTNEWRKVLTGAVRERRTRPFIAQRRFEAIPVVVGGQSRTACVGAYVIDGRFAGYYSRLAKGPVVRHDAANVLTVVEGL